MKQMVDENKIILVALIEQTYGISTEPIFKIINFLPDFKVKKIHENGLHKKIVRDNIALTLFIKMYFKYHMSEI